MPTHADGHVVDRYYALGEEVVAGTQAAVEIGAGRLNRQVREPEILVDRDLIPDARVARDGPRLLLPRVVPELARPRNRVERPQPAAGADVEAAHAPLRVVVRLRRAALEERRPDHHDAVFRDRRRRVHADLAGHEIDLLLLAEHDPVLQVDDAVPAEGSDRRAGARVERD